MNGQEIEQPMLALPPGYRDRPATLADIESTLAMLNAWSQEILGVKQFTFTDLENDWQEPGFELERDTRLVLAPDGSVAGLELVFDDGPGATRLSLRGRVHPEHSGRGIGSYLLQWAEQRAALSIAQAPPEAKFWLAAYSLMRDKLSCQVLAGSGFAQVRYGLRMVIELTGAPPQPTWPEGITVRPMVRGQDEPAMVRAVRESFQDHWGYVHQPFDVELARWTHQVEKDPTLDPNIWYLAMDGDEVAAICLNWHDVQDDKEMGWVGTLGVRRPWRRRGIAEALLLHSFADFYRRGQKRVGLGVDAQSLTGATRLYEKVGMRSDPAFQSATYHKVLREGTDLSTQTLED
jgi:GNAT superfamily N-acetyltransferase